MNTPTTLKHSYHIIALLILSGEAIFLLPFVLPRIFRPTFLDVFDVNNFQLGICFSIYGTVALVSYLLGGLIADRFQPRKLMAVALLLTAIGGVVMSTYPSLRMMNFIYGYWGCTTILLFWAAMIKATREWGGANMQGRAFGFLDGGRGLVGAGMGSVGVFIFSIFLVGSIEDASLEQRKQAFSYVLLFTSILVGLIAVAVWIWLKPNQEGVNTKIETSEKLTTTNIRTVLKIPSVWLLMVIILCGYVGYKITDDFSLYANEVMLYDEIMAAQIGSMLLYIRPVVGISVGVFADRSKSSTWMLVGFIFMLLGSLLFASGIMKAGLVFLFFLSLVATSIGVYAIRSLYFAAMHEGHIPLAVTGTAVGIMSLVGYTPDIFVGPVMGHLLDSSPGELGHRHVFMMLACFSAVGLIALIAFRRVTK